MEFSILLVIGVIVVGFALLSTALSSENRTKTDYENSKRERERAEQARLRAAEQLALADGKIANQKALALTHARQDAERQILAADRKSKREIFEAAQQAGDLQVSFCIKEIGPRQRPSIEWTWSPFGNAILKIYRNQGSIIEDIETVKRNADLIFVEQSERSGEFVDKDTRNDQTYNYYAFIESLREGYRAKEISRPIPSQMGEGEIIDAKGNRITRFDTVEPETYHENLYFGFRCERLTIETIDDERAVRRRDLDRRKEDVELNKLEQKLEQLEASESNEPLSEDIINQMLSDAKAKRAGKERLKAMIAKVERDPDLDEDEKEELIEALIERAN